MIHAHLSKELRAQYKRRSMTLRKGDEVRILRGQHAGKTGTVEEVDMKETSVFLSGMKVKRTIGTEKQFAIEPTNLVITNLNLSDKMRQKILLRKVKGIKFEEPKKEQPKPAEKKAEERPAEEKTEKTEKKKEVKKHAPEKAARAKVLAAAKKKKGVGGRAKSGTA